MAAVSTCYISCGCNRSPHSADWGPNGLVCYSTCHAIAIYQPQGQDRVARVLCTLNGHNNKINCVTWVRKADITDTDGDECLVSGSVDTTAIVWQKQQGQYKSIATLKGHTGPINSVAALTVPAEDGLSDTYVVTTSADSQVKIWRRKGDDDYNLLQTLSYGSGFALDVALTVIPKSHIPVLACGCDDQKIHLYVLQEDQFTKVISLQGHEDWIRAVDFTTDDKGDLLLASAAQDHFIRIWRISQREAGDEVVRMVKELSIDEEIKMRENTFSFKGTGGPMTFALSLDSVLSGHENWIYSVRWQPPKKMDTGYHQPMRLLSASMDKTMILWKPDHDTGVWVEEVRVGEVGGNTLGFYGGMFSPHGDAIIAHGYQGAFHHWSYDKVKETWKPLVTSSGHFSAVQDLSWDPSNGQYVVSVSLDQTTRLHAPWVKAGQETSWYEIARPQVHGYDLQCVALVHKYSMATGADEKVVRTFEATRNFIDNFCSICGRNLNKELQKEEAKNRPEGASVPALGLSNKAVFTDQKEQPVPKEEKCHPNDQYPEVYFQSVHMMEPPTEEHLLQNTLWPETQKLYGHGYEVFSLGCDPQGTVLASACKAAKAEFAGVILYDCKTWTQQCTLEGHSLTVTQIAFSHSGQFLLTVSRDRTWALYQRKEKDSADKEPLFSKVVATDKKSAVHTRIIWSCGWSHDDKYFITAARDKKVLVWRRPDHSPSGGGTVEKPVGMIDVGDSATAVDMGPVQLSNNRYIVAVGLESGSIQLYTWNIADDNSASVWKKFDQLNFHHLTVKRLKFRPCLGRAGTDEDEAWLQLASCGADHAVRIYDIDLTKV
ncbi:elongator complex protein 2-like [Ylistrum balloti]|uniref:elongator complex protein 2-like n=1 Tax=Ylistrum balloti TaxID=509963 RepID=UPI002905D175|nr:elongator complex protein 2-like [Ylistrum balloti]